MKVGGTGALRSLREGKFVGQFMRPHDRGLVRNELDKLSRLKTQLDEQDELIVRLVSRSQSWEGASDSLMEVIRRLFQEIKDALPEDTVSFIDNNDLTVLRSQIVAARSKLWARIDTIQNMRPSGVWGQKEFAQFTDEELHQTMMEAQPGSNYFEWADAELRQRDRRRSKKPTLSSGTDKAIILLRAIYERTNSRSEPVDDVTQLNVGLSAEESLTALRYLAEKGLVQTFNLPTAARVTAAGIDLIEGEPRRRNGARVEKTVFISYRRTSMPWAQSIFQDLTHHGFDVFFDFQGLASGDFEGIIFDNIRARAHFIVLLAPSALERCKDGGDLFRREIEMAIGTQRNIVPILLEGFNFKDSEIDAQLAAANLTALKRYNGLPVYPAYISEAMERLREKYLNIPLSTVLHPVSPSAQEAAKADQTAAAKAPPVTERELREAGQPRYVFSVKIEYQDEIEKVDGTRAEEPSGPGSLVIYDGTSVVARYDNVRRWSRQQHG